MLSFAALRCSSKSRSAALTAKSGAAFLYGVMSKRKLTEKVLTEILELIASGKSRDRYVTRKNAFRVGVPFCSMSETTTRSTSDTARRGSTRLKAYEIICLN